MLPALGKGCPLILLKFLPPAMVIDLSAMLFPAGYKNYFMCLLIAFVASSTKFLTTYFVDYLIGMDPTGKPSAFRHGFTVRLNFWNGREFVCPAGYEKADCPWDRHTSPRERSEFLFERKIDRMKIYIGFDDTDTIDSDRGTGELARWFESNLPSECRMLGVIRQQLPKAARIPFTSNISSAGVIADSEQDITGELIRLPQTIFRSWISRAATRVFACHR